MPSPGNSIPTPFSLAKYKNMRVTLQSSYTGTRSTTVKGTAVIGSSENSPGAFNFSTATFNGINIVVKNNPNGNGPEIGGINGKNLLGFSVYNSLATIDTIANAAVLPTRDVSGFEFPETGGGASYIFENCSASGFKWGSILGEHVLGNNISSSVCYNAFGLKGAGHSSSYPRINSYWCVNGLAYYPYAANESGLPVLFTAAEFDMEWALGNTQFWNTSYGIKDTAKSFCIQM